MGIVAPHTGAWIETDIKYDLETDTMSHPTRVRGLKLARLKLIFKIKVAPHTGAWIETIEVKKDYIEFGRTPHGCVD